MSKFYIHPNDVGLYDAKEMSNGQFSVKCPFHDDHSPSASYDPFKGLFHCHACSTSATHVGLAKQTGVKNFGTSDATPPTKRGGDGVDVDDITNFNRMSLALGDRYLNSREVFDDLVQRFNIRGNDSVVAFPFIVGGGVVGFQTRDKEYKEYRFWGKRAPVWPMENLEDIYQHDRLYLVEGVFGALRGISAGFNVVASCGASNRSAMSTLSVLDNVRAIYDVDPAGVLASAKAIAWGIPCRVGGDHYINDPDDMTVEEWVGLDKSGYMFSNKISDLIAANEGMSKRISSAFKKEVSFIERMYGGG